jgi:molecular chaperone GrpE (heat shock protein)
MKTERRSLRLLLVSTALSLSLLGVSVVSTAAAAFLPQPVPSTGGASPAPQRSSRRRLASAFRSSSTKVAFGVLAHPTLFTSSTTLLRSSGSSGVENDETARTTRASAEPAADNEPDTPKKEAEEDPELVALKQEIASVESALKAKKRTLLATRDSVEEYSKQGYARKVAEMENMRRNRSTLNKSNRSYATAAVIAEFVPSYDKLLQLKEQYSEVPFAKQYEALSGTMRSAFSELGVQDYVVSEGDKVNRDTMNVVEQRNSESAAKGVVLEVVSNRGLELQGNVVRQADVVASLGPLEEVEEAPEPPQPEPEVQGGAEDAAAGSSE